MQQIQNDPFPLIEQFLGQRAMSQVDQATEPMKQEAIQKVSGVMSGIRSLVNEAFPNMGGGGMSTTGQLGQGIASLGGTAIPAAPFTKPAEIPSTPMQPENDILKKFGITTTNYQGPVTTPGFTGPNSQNTYVGGVLVNPTPKVPSFMDESGGAIDFSIVDNPLQEPPMIPKIGADVEGPVTSEEAYNPAMEYFNPISPMPIQKQVEDPLINLAYNFNMENSPF